MSLAEIDHRPSDLTVDEARELTDNLRRTGDRLTVQIKSAWSGRVWLALGYDSWAEWADGELPGMSLPKAERQEVVAELHAEGMSVRAIASAIGASKSQVDRDVAGVPNGTPADDSEDQAYRFAPVTMTPARTAALAVARAAVDSDDDIVDAEVLDTPTVTIGLDGKSYTRPAPAADRRPPLTDAIDKAGWELRRRCDALLRIADDDRFKSHKEKVAPALGSHLKFAISVCQDLLDRLDTTQEQ